MPVFEASSLSHLTIKTPHHQVTTLTPDALRQLLQADPAHWLHLFPQKWMLLAWEPYLVTADVLQRFVSTGNVQFYGTNASKPDHAEEYSLLSAGSYYPCEVGLSYHADIFGTAAGREEIKDHINVHLRRLKDMAHILTGRVVFNVFASEMLDEVVADVTRLLNTFKLEGLKPNEIMTLWERELDELSPSSE